jgi:hypothetical protein
MMDLRTLRDLVVEPVLFWLGPPYGSLEAEIMLLAIAGQESGCGTRCQAAGGPARSVWQIEPATAAAVLGRWPAGRSALAELLLWPAWTDRDALAQGLQWSELGAAVIARGILWLEPRPLPALGDLAAAWAYYAEHTWRPGRPCPGTWPDAYGRALRCAQGLMGGTRMAHPPGAEPMRAAVLSSVGAPDVP